MNKTALQAIPKTLNIISNLIDAVTTENKWATLELMLASGINSTTHVSNINMLHVPITRQ